MTPQWYYALSGKTFGPVSVEALKQLVSTRDLAPTDKVSKDGLDGWMDAGLVDGLFAGLSVPAVPDHVVDLTCITMQLLVAGACQSLELALGEKAVERVFEFLADRFLDRSQRLTKALGRSQERAWQALEIALAGPSLWQSILGRAEDKALAEQIRLFVQETPLPGLAAGNADFRKECLRELRAARKDGALALSAGLDARHLARKTAHFARFADPGKLQEAEWLLVEQMGRRLQVRYPNLGQLVCLRPLEGMPLLVLAARYFFRRAVEEDRELFQGLAFAQLQALKHSQDQGFAALAALQAQQSQRLEALLEDAHFLLVQTHAVAVDTQARVLDLQEQLRGQSEQIRQLGQDLQHFLAHKHMHLREVRPHDSFAVASEGELEAVRGLIERYRALPEPDRRRLPALLNAVGKAEVIAGNFEAARHDFQQVAALTADVRGCAEAHASAFQAALESEDHATALRELLEAARLDPGRFEPFPLDKYTPLKILGAGGFGVAFLCKHRYMDAQVVVKVLVSDHLGLDPGKVFTEAQILRQLDHPGIVRISDCGYCQPPTQSRPFLVMDYFEGENLQQWVEEKGPLSVGDLSLIARPLAEALQAAHSKGILHRDVKPANVLVRRENGGWRVKIIDFGLGMRPQLAVRGVGASARQNKTVLGRSIGGTIHYAAPEQMGQLAVALGTYTDVYGFARTCCYALFRTPMPLPRHFRDLPASLTALLESCLEEKPSSRLGSFKGVLDRLRKIDHELIPEVTPAETASAHTPPPSAAAWYYLRGGQKFGPFPEAELKRLAATGGLLGSDMIWRTGWPNWVLARGIPGFLPQPPATPLPPLQPLPPLPPLQMQPPQPPAASGPVTGEIVLEGKGGQVGQERCDVLLNGKMLGEGFNYAAGFRIPFEAVQGQNHLQLNAYHHILGLGKLVKKMGGQQEQGFPLTLDRPGHYRIVLSFAPTVWMMLGLRMRVPTQIQVTHTPPRPG